MNEQIKIGEPWIDERGNKISVQKLKLISKNWDRETWNRYLDYIEPAQKEKIVSTKRIERELNSPGINIFSFGSENFKSDKPRIHALMSTLTEKQRQVIKLFFWKNLSHRKIAAILNVDQSTIAEIKQSAIKKMRELAISNPVSAPIDTRAKKNNEPKEERNVQKHSA